MGGEFIFSVFSTLTGLLSCIRSGPTTEKDEDDGIEKDLNRLETLLKRIQATISDGGQGEIQDEYEKLWFKEITSVAYEAEDILDECQYDLLRHQKERSGQATSSSVRSRKRNRLGCIIPDGIAERIKCVIDRFDEISKDKNALSLRRGDGGRRGSFSTGLLPTSHMVNESTIFGLDQDKKKILELVLHDVDGSKSCITVIPIFGIGGVGKTTLAQLVYNDPVIERYFDIRAWVYVLPEFNVFKITRDILGHVLEYRLDNLNTLSAMQWALTGLVKEKNVFLVLDDVWNELPSKWEQFLLPFRCAKSAIILVTTRNKSIAQIVSTAYEHELRGLPEDQCISLFEYYAFSNRITDRSSRLREISVQIIRKCAGLPLAIKSVATALGTKRDQDSWTDVLNSELWECDGKDEIFPALKVSYYNLPPSIKPCLLFCSLFPKGFQFWKNEIIYMWIAHGYIQSRGSKSAEVLGNEFIQELHRRCFIQLAKKRWLETFTLHDLIHDLARSVSMGEFCTITRSQFGDQETIPIDSGVRHLYLEDEFMDSSNCLLRTIISNISRDEPILPTRNYYVSNRLGYYIHQYRNLRVLKWDCVHEGELNEYSMANLKHLRYFELSNGELGWIPISISCLYNLVTLKLTSLSELRELPAHIGELVNLRSLFITSVKIKELPESVRQLSNLQCLHLCSCPYIKEIPNWIGDLANLKELHILKSKITKLPESFCMLRKLEVLVLDQCWSFCTLPHGIGNLTSLRYIYVLESSLGCGTTLPYSINQLHNLQVLELSTTFSVSRLVAGLSELLYKKSLYISIEEKEDDSLVTRLTRMENISELLKYEHKLRHWFDKKIRIKNIGMCNKYRKSECLIECLQPLGNLVELKLNGYEGVGYPRWIGSKHDNDNVGIFMQYYCRYGKLYRELEELPSLKSLSLIGWNFKDAFHP